jgi:hypothetical protein
MRSSIAEMCAGNVVHESLAGQLFACLRKMDAEAVALEDGTPTGLHGYKGFVDGAFKPTPGTPWENCWNDRIAELLTVDGVEVLRECRYADGDRQRCDLVIKQKGASPLWIEVKGCWRVLVDESTSAPGRQNASFRKHLARAAHDIDKLLAIPASSASHVGLLIVGFDTDDSPITDADLSIVRNRAAGWRESMDSWDDLAYPGFRIRCWFWTRSVAS